MAAHDVANETSPCHTLPHPVTPPLQGKYQNLANSMSSMKPDVLGRIPP